MITKAEILKVIASEKRPNNTGSHCRYYTLNSKYGFKLFLYGSLTPKNLKKSVTFKNVLTEIRNLKKARKKANFIPECYGYRVIKIRKIYRIGILMQHLGKISLSHRHYKQKKVGHVQAEKIESTMGRKLEKHKIYHCDIHDENILYHKGKYWMVDFGTHLGENMVRFRHPWPD